MEKSYSYFEDGPFPKPPPPPTLQEECLDLLDIFTPTSTYTDLGKETWGVLNASLARSCAARSNLSKERKTKLKNILSSMNCTTFPYEDEVLKRTVQKQAVLMSKLEEAKDLLLRWSQE